MAHDESFWSEKAKSLESQLGALKQQIDPVIERYTAFKANFGVKEKSDGSISIDFDKFVERLGQEGCAELRKVMDEKCGAAPKPEPSGITYYETVVGHSGPPTIASPKASEAMPLQPGDIITADGVTGEFVGYAQDGKPRFKVKAKAA